LPGDLSRLLNALGLILVDTVLALAFVDQLWFRDLPHPDGTHSGLTSALEVRYGP